MSSLKAGLELNRPEKFEICETHVLETSYPMVIRESSIIRSTTIMESPFNTNQSATFNSEQSIQLLLNMFALGGLVYQVKSSGNKVSEVNIRAELWENPVEFGEIEILIIPVSFGSRYWNVALADNTVLSLEMIWFKNKVSQPVFSTCTIFKWLK